MSPGMPLSAESRHHARMAIWSRPGTTAVDGRLIAGRYRLAEQLGSGGMGAVWAGRDTLVDREVALKEAHFPEHFAADGRARAARVARILREARAAARIDHPAVVTIYDVVMHDSRPWIVMERVYGENLGERLKRQAGLSEEEAARIAGSVAEALGAAHARGVLHRDVKPANVLLGSDARRVVLTDFGIAQIEGEDSLTRSGEFVGSFEYTAPERMGGLKPGPPADLWSLGVMLFQMTEGWSPFRRPTVEGTVAAVLTTHVPRPVKAAGLAPLITALLERDPADRPTAAEAVETLRVVGVAAYPLPARQELDGGAPQARPAPAPRLVVMSPHAYDGAWWLASSRQWRSERAGRPSRRLPSTGCAATPIPAPPPGRRRKPRSATVLVRRCVLPRPLLRPPVTCA